MHFRAEGVFWLDIGILILLLLETPWASKPGARSTLSLAKTGSDLLECKGSDVKLREISLFVVMLLSVLNLRAWSINMFV